jgi:spore germination protein
MAELPWPTVPVAHGVPDRPLPTGAEQRTWNSGDAANAGTVTTCELCIRSRTSVPPCLMAGLPTAEVSRRVGQATFSSRGGRRREQRGRPRHRIVAAVTLLALCLGLIYLCYPRPPGQRLVVATVPYWNIDYGTTSVLENPNTFSEMSPWMYGLNGSGQIVPQYSPAQAATVDAQLARLRAARIPLVPTLANVVGGTWVYQPVVTSILYVPRLRAQHIAAIVALVQRQHYAGIDIDYEDLRAGDRSAFTAFITQLAGALHAKGKVLSVDLFAKPDNRGYDQRNLAQDYHAIGAVADQVRLMGYEYHWATSQPGPIAPIGWIRAVLRYATTQIPAQKIILGVPLYGYDWVDGHGTPVSWLQAFQLSKQYGVHPHFDDASQSPWFDYTDSSGRRHVVWFENGPSTEAKFEAAESAGIGGVYVWLYGLEDTSIWTALRQNLPRRMSAASVWRAGT